ncbi:MAG: DNA topoisomerase IV subunit A [Victivallales bacterium]|nr:DNA topoisomerase IV subunit A [Victivallales bacterium]
MARKKKISDIDTPELVPANEVNDADTDGTSATSNGETAEFAKAGEGDVADGTAIADGSSEAEMVSGKAGNTFLRRLMDMNFIEYASYVIKERAIPDVDDGLKPVQRRILWSLFRMDDGKFHKVANVIGHTMQYHPHGDASIGEALVVLANKEYYIDKQGNFGNILTGDPASAARYIECRLKPLAKEILFNNDITEFIDSYDGRNREPVVLPAKIPSLLMLGADGIAVGMSTRVLPHNFKELIEAQIAILRNKGFDIYPDFQQGGIMDVSEYDDGNGKVKVRARIEKDGRRLIIREIPFSTTTESLIASIEQAVEKNKMKLASINDFTGEKVEIEIVPMRGYDVDKALKALYAYTSCSVSISVNLMVIVDGAPVQMTVPEVLRRNTDKLLDYLRRELEIELNKLHEKFHEKTLVQIFIENRIYKRIEECKTYELVLSEVHDGLKKFRRLLRRAVTDEDVEKLLAVQIRRISLFDINRNKKDLDDILKGIEEVEKNLATLKKYAINYLKSIIKKFDIDLERRTEIEKFDKIDRQTVALNNIVVGWDRKNCYIGTGVKSDDRVRCNEYDHLLVIERTGKYKVINIPDKIFIGRIYYFAKYDKDQIYYVVYSDKKTGRFYAKKCNISSFITDREYRLCPTGCKLEIITSRANSVYDFTIDGTRKGTPPLEFNLSDSQTRGAKARGVQISTKKILGYKFKGIAETTDDSEDPDIPPDDTSPPAGEQTQADKPKPPKRQEKRALSKPDKKSPNRKKIATPKSSANNDDKDDWGIQQPEFGF